MLSATGHFKRLVILGLLLFIVMGFDASFASSSNFQEQEQPTNRHPLLFPTRTPSGQFIPSPDNIIQISGTGSGIAISPDETLLYVTIQNGRRNPGRFEVVNIDKGGGNSWVETGPIPEEIFVTSDGLQAYIKHFSNALSVVDLNTLEVFELNFGVEEYGQVALSPDGSIGYISTFQDVILLIDIATNTLLESISFEASGSIASMAISKDASTLFIANASADTFMAVNLDNFETIYEIHVPGDLSDMAITQDEQKALVVNRSPEGISIITFLDLANQEISGNIQTFDFERDLIISSDGDRAYATNSINDWISVIDVENEIYLGPAYKVGDGPFDLTLTLDSTEAYVVSSDQTLTHLDLTLATEEEIFHLNIPAGSFPNEIAITPDGSRALVNNFDETVAQIDLTINKSIMPNIPIGYRTEEILISPDGTRAVVRESSVRPRMSIIDLASNEVLRINPSGSGMVIAPDKNVIYVDSNDRTGERLKLISLDTGEIVETLTFNAEFYKLFMGTDPDTMYSFSNQDRDKFYIIGLDTKTVKSEIPLTKSGFQALIAPDDSKAFILNRSTSSILLGESISVVDLINRQILAEISLDELTDTITMTPDGNQIYATHKEAGTISVIDTTTYEKLGHSIFVGGEPEFITITPDGTRAYWVQGGVSDAVSSMDLTRELHFNGPDPDEFTISKFQFEEFTESLSFDKNEKRLYVTHADQISVIDTEAETLIGLSIGLRTSIKDIEVVPSKNRLLVVDDVFGDRPEHLFFIDLNTLELVKQIPLETASDDKILIVTNDGEKAYVGNDGNGIVSVIDLSTEKKIGELSIGAVEHMIADPVRPRLYALRSSHLSVIDTESDTEIKEIDTIGLSDKMAVSPDGSRLYYEDFNELRAIDLNSLELLPEAILVGGSIHHIEINQAGNRAYILNFSHRSLVIVDLETMKKLAELPISRGQDLIIMPDEQKAYVTTDQLRVIDLEALVAASLN